MRTNKACVYMVWTEPTDQCSLLGLDDGMMGVEE